VTDEANTSELELAEQLVSFDEALKRGGGTTPQGDSEVRRAQECLKLLEEFWPRHPKNAPTLVQTALAAAQARLDFAAVPPPAAVGRFRVVRELGRGGFGIVYLAHDPKLGRDVALKVPRADVVHSAELRERFQQEARAAAGLDHPNLVPVYETGEEGAVCWIASAYCHGVNLAEWLRQRTEPVPLAEAARLVADLADGVQHAHARGILHRDLKPANILLQSEDKETRRQGERNPILLVSLSPCLLVSLSPCLRRLRTSASPSSPTLGSRRRPVPRSAHRRTWRRSRRWRAGRRSGRRRTSIHSASFSTS
jgi:serine/threonine protein kinase